MPGAIFSMCLVRMDPGMGFHSSTFRLNVSAICGIGSSLMGALRGC